MAAPPRNPLDVTLPPEKFAEIERRLVEEVRTAKAARSVVMQDDGLIDYCYAMYEQRSQQAISQNNPTAGEPDLTSPIGTETVDTLSARAAQTLFRQEPFWMVEGIGDANAKKAPVVEAYIQFRQEDMRFQKTAKRAITASFVETGSVLEVCEDAEKVICRDVLKAKIKVSDVDGTMVLDGDSGKPLPMLDEAGDPVPAEQADIDGNAYVEVKQTYPDFRRRGAYVRRRSMKDFMFLPNHAEDEREVWAHATRFFLTAEEVQRRIDNKDFRAECLNRLGLDSMERQQSPEADRANVTVLATPGTGHAEKELWQVQLWADLDGKGLACYMAVVSEQHGCVLSLRYDWLRRWRTVYLNPFPSPYSVYGYSLIFTKLGTTIEEHTAWRNMNALRATLASNAPMKRLRGSQWDPRIQPFGAGEVVDVDNMNEIMPFEFKDVSAQALNKEQQCVSDSQRIIGINDVAIGQLSAEKRTLGENEMATRQSFVRTDDPIANIQEAFEEVGQIIHAIEVQTLTEMQTDAPEGMTAPSSVTQSLKLGADPSFNGTFTADAIGPIGGYRFKPRGSSDAADPNQRKRQLTDMFQGLAMLAKVMPGVQMRLQSQEMSDAAMQMFVDEWKPRDPKAFLTMPQPPAAMPGAPGAPMMPGQPPPAGLPAGAPNFGGEQLVQGLLPQAQGAAQ